MDIDSKLILSLATLARLDLSPDEQRHFAEQLPKILDYVSQLQVVQTEAVPDVRPPQTSWRVDERQPSRQADDILTQAPERDDRLWRVPPVF